MPDYPETTYIPVGEHVADVKKMELKRGDECRAPWVDASIFVMTKTGNGDVNFHELELAPLTNMDGETTAGRQKFVNWQLESLGLTANLDVEDGVADTAKLINEVEDDLLNARRATKLLLEVKPSKNPKYTEAVYKQNLGGTPAPPPQTAVEDIANAFDGTVKDEEAQVF